MKSFKETFGFGEHTPQGLLPSTLLVEIIDVCRYRRLFSKGVKITFKVITPREVSGVLYAREYDLARQGFPADRIDFKSLINASDLDLLDDFNEKDLIGKKVIEEVKSFGFCYRNGEPPTEASFSSLKRLVEGTFPTKKTSLKEGENRANIKEHPVCPPPPPPPKRILKEGVKPSPKEK